jgi:hypothetical protein
MGKQHVELISSPWNFGIHEYEGTSSQVGKLWCGETLHQKEGPRNLL